MRKAVVAGMFYARRKDDLVDQLKGCFESKMGPGLPSGKKKFFAKAVVAPHAGYAYSGQCAAHAYKLIAESEPASTYIILGTDHSGFGTATCSDDWETPLGIVEADKELVKEIAAKTGIPDSADAHTNEHSIEVQLPFLQLVLETDFKIAPITVSHDIDVLKFGNSLKKIIKNSKKRICIIASSDFTHYGRIYGYVPFRDDVKNKMYDLDNKAIDLIKKMDSKGFLSYVGRTGATICGAAGIAVLLNAVDAKKIKLLKYYTSGDITGSYGSAVGYAAVSFE